MPGSTAESSIVDSHVHFWDPDALTYPWLAAHPVLDRSFSPGDYFAAMAGVPVEKIVFVEANPSPDRSVDEIAAVARLAADDPRIGAIVAFVPLSDASRRDALLDMVSGEPLVRGVRHNIQGEDRGFCLTDEFRTGVTEVGKRGFTFDLCATHDQLDEVVELVGCAPNTRFILDHCGKPGIRSGEHDSWAKRIARLAERDNVWCKLSGMITEADPARWRDDDLLPYARTVFERFGTERVMYGSDWPVVTLASRASDWYPFTRRLTDDWSDAERHRLYAQNAIDFYGL